MNGQKRAIEIKKEMQTEGCVFDALNYAIVAFKEKAMVMNSDQLVSDIQDILSGQAKPEYEYRKLKYQGYQ